MSMTIKSVRIYFYPRGVRRERWLTANYWGWAEWFELRLKPVREQLRGIEVKGVDIVNLMLREESSKAWLPNTWTQLGNTLMFEFVCNLKPLESGNKMENMQHLMNFYATVAKAAPWPQMKVVAAALEVPLSTTDKISLEPYLHWPRKVGRTAKYFT
jgi:hypothetical protein